MQTARDIMTKTLSTIRPDASVREAIETLLDQEISGLPVLDEEGQLVGIVTEFALLATIYDRKALDHPVSEHMTQDILFVNADEGVNKVADLCVVHRIRRVPVLEDGKLVGLISRRDVLRSVYESETANAVA